MLKLLILSVIIGVAKCESLYDFKVNDIQGNPVDFKQFKGKTLLLVNVASQCGQTDSHYKALKRLHDILSYNNKFSVLAFPCNDFGEQEPWEPKEIEEFVRGHFKAEFPVFNKVKILGENQNPFWKFVIEKSGTSPSWNFQKYLFDGKGNFISSWDSSVSIESIFEKIKTVIDDEDLDKINFNKQEL